MEKGNNTFKMKVIGKFILKGVILYGIHMKSPVKPLLWSNRQASSEEIACTEL